MNLKPMFTLLLAALLFTACNSQSSVKNLSVTDFEKGMNAADAQLVDVRTPEEYSAKHIANATNIDINNAAFEKKLNELDKLKPIYIYCLAGSRSEKAATAAANLNFKEIYTLKEGINAWVAAKKPLENTAKQKVNIDAIGLSFDAYLAHLKESKKIVLVDFSAVWCGPCKMLKPTVAKLVKNNEAQLELFDIDVDKNPSVANAMNIRSIPLLVLYKEGKEVWRNLGMIDENSLNNKIAPFLK